jgi:hypothetical protein
LKTIIEKNILAGKRKTSDDEDSMSRGKVRGSRVERALKAAWGNPPDEIDEEAQMERDLAI